MLMADFSLELRKDFSLTFPEMSSVFWISQRHQVTLVYGWLQCYWRVHNVSWDQTEIIDLFLVNDKEVFACQELDV